MKDECAQLSTFTRLRFGLVFAECEKEKSPATATEWFLSNESRIIPRCSCHTFRGGEMPVCLTGCWYFLRFKYSATVGIQLNLKIVNLLNTVAQQQTLCLSRLQAVAADKLLIPA